MKLYDELRDLTRLYMAKHDLSQKRMADLVGVSQPAIRTWAYPSESAPTTVLNSQAMEKLVDLLRDDGLMVQRLARGRVAALRDRIRKQDKPGRGGRALSAKERL